MVPKTRIVNGDLKVYICLLGDDVLEALFGRCRMIGGHSPNCSIGELRDRFGSAMNLDYIYERHPEWERHPPRLNMIRKRPSHFKRELRANSCDLESCWAAAVKAAESILTKYGVQMAMTFSERFQKKDTDLSRPFGGKYPAISGGIDRSLADLDGHSNEEELIDPKTINFANLVAGVDIDAMIQSEKEADEIFVTIPRSLFAEIDTAGNLTHKKSILRTFFAMTPDTRTSHDRLQRVRGFTIGGKSWDRDLESGENISAATHFQLGNLFTTLLSHNGTHLGLAQVYCPRVKTDFPVCLMDIRPFWEYSTISRSRRRHVSHCRPPGPPVQPSRFALSDHLDSPIENSPFLLQEPSSISLLHHIQSLDKFCPLSHRFHLTVPTPHVQWAWDGGFIAFCLNKKKNSGEKTTHRRNLQITTSSRLIDCNITHQALEISASDLPGTRESTWSFRNSDLVAAWNKLWSLLLNDASLHEKFPVFTAVLEGKFPYQSHAVIYASPIANTAIEESIQNRNACRVFGKAVKGPDRQQHVGEHISEFAMQPLDG
ncbi:hypothetical protein R3P38DRAFT_3296758 [Favolaschia claudopus]|uniref:Uncharacterized protein n=1 Tax=Favolaschia claudopus TaxID=2862362 RepID=A0AAV9Z8Y6_9AGAR